MRLQYLILFIAVMSISGICFAEDAPLERGVKGDIADVVLVGADDWHAAIASTPLAIWSLENQTKTVPMLILPKAVQAGDRNGWVEESDLQRYGVSAILSTFKAANISAITIHAQPGDLVKSLVDAAHKDGLKAYITATLEVPIVSEPLSENDIKELPEARKAMLTEAGLTLAETDDSKTDKSLLQVANPDVGGNATYYCPANPEARENLYNLIEKLITDYKADGIVLYNFGFQDGNYCYCNICKEKFYQDTGIDLSKANSNSYNQERWVQWKQEQLMEIVKYARNITTDLGPVKLGAAFNDPSDRSRGYNFAEISKITDFSIVSPLSAQDAGEVCLLSKKPVYVRLSADYLGYVLSTMNVDGAVKYMEDLIRSGSAGVSFEYNVVHTPVWPELQPASKASLWLLGQLGGKTLAVGNVSRKSDEKIAANSSFEMAEKISRYWKSSPGAVIVGENYSASLIAAPIASYLNWPLLFVGSNLPNETLEALSRLNAKQAVIVGPISPTVRRNLSEMNITLLEGSSEFLVQQMLRRGDKPNMIVFTNSHDFSLLPPAPNPVVKRTLISDLLVKTEMSPSQIPAEELGEIVRLNITMTNTGKDTLKDVRMLDVFPMGRLIKWPRPQEGEANITDPYTGQPSNAMNSFLNGSMLRWNVNRLEPDRSTSLNVEVELLYPMDAGWKERLDTGATAAYEGFSYNHTIRNLDDGPVTNLTYPTWIYSGRTNISWNLDQEASYTSLNLYSPEKRTGSIRITDIKPDKLYEVRVQMLTPGKWIFNIEAGNGFTHKTENYTIDVRSNIDALNITSFSHTKVPRLSMVAPAAAAARKGILVDVARDPQQIDPLVEEQRLKQKVEDLMLSPRYMMVVGDPGSMPFMATGQIQKLSDIMEYEVYRDYQLSLNEENYSTVAVGRILGLSVYDASQLLARTMAYDRLNGSWKDNALVISSPPLSYPQAPIAMRIRDYLAEAGLRVKDLRYEEATYQQVISQMNNGQNIVHFDHHGNENAWQLSDWSMMDSSLTTAHVKELTLSPQTTTSSACVTANLKGHYLNVTGTRMFIPIDLEDSIALAFIRAGSVNYIGDSALSWIFLSDDALKRFYQSLIFENATVGEAVLEADNLYRLKFQGAGNIKDISDYDESLPDWDTSVSDMLNQTAYMDIMLGDPSFRPAIPEKLALPYSTVLHTENTTGDNKSIIRASVTPKNESATDWIYWIETDSSSGQLNLNAPPVIIGEVLLPKDADKIVVKEDGLSIWHDEYTLGDKKKVMWPIMRPKLAEEKDFEIEYQIIPTQTQRINITAGWNAVAIYLKPKDATASRYLANRPYRSIFSMSGADWGYGMKDGGLINVTRFSPGEGYLIDSAGNFTIEISGKPVDLPYRINLNAGWNMIGLPVNRTVDLGNITVNTEHKRYRYQEAVAKGLVSAFVWKYDGKSWTHLGNNETLVPGMAYLFEAMNEAKLEFR